MRRAPECHSVAATATSADPEQQTPPKARVVPVCTLDVAQRERLEHVEGYHPGGGNLNAAISPMVSSTNVPPAIWKGRSWMASSVGSS